MPLLFFQWVVIPLSYKPVTFAPNFVIGINPKEKKMEKIVFRICGKRLAAFALTTSLLLTGFNAREYS